MYSKCVYECELCEFARNVRACVRACVCAHKKRKNKHISIVCIKLTIYTRFKFDCTNINLSEAYNSLFLSLKP